MNFDQVFNTPSGHAHVFGNAGDWCVSWEQHYHADEPVYDSRIHACPFCDSNAVRLQNTYTPSYYVICDNCGANGPNGHPVNGTEPRYRTRKVALAAHAEAATEAINRWNDAPRRR